MASIAEKPTTLTSATESLRVAMNELSGMLGCSHEPTSEEKQLALPTPAEQSVFDVTKQILHVTSRLMETHVALTSLLGAIGD